MKIEGKKLFGSSYKGLYYLISFFIKIGEKTRILATRIFLLIRNLVTKTKLPSVKLPRIPIPDRIKYFFLGISITVLSFFLYESYLFVKQLPSPYSIGKINYPLSTHILDRNGKLLYEIYREQNRTPVRLSDLPDYISKATIAIEDKDFYKHYGVALVSGILRAAKETFVNQNLQGGSTITQQLVKSSLLTSERTIQRKIKEVILALWTERIYSKDEILEMYLNQVPYGGSSYGIEEAAKTYFGKSSKELDLAEAALLAGLPQAPSSYSPYTNPQKALKRRNEVLQKMRDLGFINESTKARAEKTRLNVLPPKMSIKAPHFVFYVKSQLESYYGIKTVEEGGLRVKTTLDYELQQEAEKILTEELNKVQHLNVTNGAILITRPPTGEILAMVGSADYFAEGTGSFNVTTATRQPGSSIKPIMYALALEKGLTAASVVDDSPVIFNIPGSVPYRPVNYDNKFHGKVPLRYALANSYNIPAVKVLNSLGVDSFLDFAKKMGIDTWSDRSRYGLSLTLGGGEVTMVDMAEAYGVLANLGYRLPLTYYLEISNSDDRNIRDYRPFKIRELDPGIAYIISDILSDDFARRWAFGSGSYLEIPGYKAAVKTGTTNDKRDNWTIGYTPEFLVVVWVGNNDNTPMNPYLTSGVTGAAPIWNRVMNHLLSNYGDGNQWYSKPGNIVEKDCFYGRKELFISGTENKVSCSKELIASPTEKDKEEN